MEIWKPSSVGVIGLGYVGLPLAVGFAQAGLTVRGVEQNADKVTRVNAGDSYIDDVAPARLQAVVSTGALTASTQFSVLEGCDAVVVCVPTPLTINKAPEVSDQAKARLLRQLGDIDPLSLQRDIGILQARLLGKTSQDISVGAVTGKTISL